MEQLDHIVNILGLDSADHVELLQNLTRILKVKRGSYIALAFYFIILFLIMIGIASSFFSSLLGLIYPVYKTLETIEIRSIRLRWEYIIVIDFLAEKQWLTYWIIYTTLTVFDSNFVFMFQFLPFYHFFKCLFFIYLFHPQFLGALKIFESVITLDFQIYSLVDLTSIQEI